MPDHFEVILRTIAAFSILLISARFLGKQTISQMNIFDFIVTITLGSITASIAYNIDLQPHHTILSFGLFVLIAFFVAYLSTKSRRIRKYFAGDPTVLIQNGKILENNMRKMRYTLDYLNQQLREKDVFNIQEVMFAILEPHGTLSVVKKPQYRPVTRQDLLLHYTPESTLPIELIMDGEIVKKNLVENNLSEDWLQMQLQNRQLTLKEVLYAVLLANGTIYFDTYKDHISSPVDAE